MISLLTNSWSRVKASNEFKVSEHMVKLTRILVKKQGILPELQKTRALNAINEERNQTVESFYEDDKNCNLMPREKDCFIEGKWY